MGPMVVNLPRLAILFGALMILAASMADRLAAEPVKPLADAKCDDGRGGIEWSVPFGPGFRGGWNSNSPRTTSASRERSTDY